MPGKYDGGHPQDASTGLDANAPEQALRESVSGEVRFDRASRALYATDAISGCCGMAGASGFEKDTYDVSMRCAERVLPAVRSAAADTLVIADGHSCREQIARTTRSHPLPLSGVLRTARQGDARGYPSMA